MADTTLSVFMDWLANKNPNQPEFTQAVHEIVQDLESTLANDDLMDAQKILYRLSEPDRVISFRVCWEDDQGRIHVNRGYRVQHCGALGPYKGGLRFHPTVNESVLKFLAFEQTFKNALTGLPLGGGKGGADFDPRGKSDRDIMRFCQAFMNELHRHIGETVDVPAGDINVGKREIGYLFGQYRRLANQFTGALTGKDLEFGGSHVRTEATGFGLIYFLQKMLAHSGDTIDGKRVSVSGAGNVALHAALKAAQEGAIVQTLSNSEGSLYAEGGFDEKTIQQLIDANKRPDLKLLAESLNAQWCDQEKPWQFEGDIALPCGTQNELDESDAQDMVKNNFRWLAEGANMPCTEAAIDVLNENQIFNAPGKASNAGGVALSGLEMSQNAGFTRKVFDELDQELRDIMHQIHQQCVDFGRDEHAKQTDWINYRRGANLAAFERVSSALLAQGIG